MTGFLDRLQRAASRAGVGETQSEIAEALGLNRQTVHRWFKGGEPEADQVFEIARRWNVSAAWLKSGFGEMLPTPSEGYSQDERELVRYYRSASPQVRHVISTMVRAVRKAVVTVALAVPPLLVTNQTDASATVYYVKSWLRRFLMPCGVKMS